MLYKTSVYKKLLIVVGLMLVAAGCETASFDKLGDPKYAWVNGTWSNEGSWPQTLILSVGDGNRIKGRYDLTSENTGRTYSGSVNGEVNGERLKLTASMYDGSLAGVEYKFSFERFNDMLSGSRVRESTNKEWSLTLRKK